MRVELKIIDLLMRNVEKKFTVNEIAKALNAYYSHVYKSVNKLAKEGVVIKEKVGKSHLCSLNFDNEKTIALIQLDEIERRNDFYNLKKEIKIILEDFVKAIRPSNPLTIVLFGSYAKNIATKESDIDILVIGKNLAKIDIITKEIYSKYDKEINVVMMSAREFKKQKSKAIIKEIIKNHYVLYGVEKFVDLIFK
jgi:predicted nucleotidyltransferase